MEKTLIISMHGILTDIGRDADNDWQERFDNWLRADNSESMSNKTLVHLPFSYGFMRPIMAWATTSLNAIGLSKLVDKWSVAKFSKFIRAAQQAYPGYKVHVVAHSFGTWVAHETLKDCSDVKVSGLHLFGAVISAHINKNFIDEALMLKQVWRCINWCSHEDIVVRFAPPPFGHLGYWGFLTADQADRVMPRPKPFSHLELYNNFTKHGHSTYFVVQTFKQLMQDIQLINKLARD